MSQDSAGILVPFEVLEGFEATGLDPSEFLVLAFLQGRGAKADWNAFELPVPTVCRAVGFQERHVRSLLGALREKGYISVEYPPGQPVWLTLYPGFARCPGWCAPGATPALAGTPDPCTTLQGRTRGEQNTPPVIAATYEEPIKHCSTDPPSPLYNPPPLMMGSFSGIVLHNISMGEESPSDFPHPPSAANFPSLANFPSRVASLPGSRASRSTGGASGSFKDETPGELPLVASSQGESTLQDSAALRSAAVAVAAARERIKHVCVRRAEKTRPPRLPRETPRGAAPRPKKGTTPAAQVHARFSQCWRAKYPTLPFTSWSVKELAQAKRLVAEYGLDVVLVVVGEVIAHWGAFQASHPRMAAWYPTIGVIAGFRSSFFPQAIAQRERLGLTSGQPPAQKALDQEHPELEVFARLDAEIAEAHRRASMDSTHPGGTSR